jgi:phosphatidylglycerophosphate synthase
MTDEKNRRPLRVRNANLARRFAGWLSRKNITPNQISVLSVLFAVLAAGCFIAMRSVDGQGSWLVPIAAAVFIQCRLLCNLFDGMVAIEGGKSTKSGELFNDIPDRIADPIILVAAGYAVPDNAWVYSIGWAAGLGSLMTAYIRTVCVAAGAPVDFRGPMAKQHRMAVITFACIVAAGEQAFGDTRYSLPIALAIVTVGCIVTSIRRTRSAYAALESS